MPEVMQTANSYSPQGHKEADTTEATELVHTVFTICTLIFTICTLIFVQLRLECLFLGSQEWKSKFGVFLIQQMFTACPW